MYPIFCKKRKNQNFKEFCDSVAQDLIDAGIHWDDLCPAKAVFEKGTLEQKGFDVLVEDGVVLLFNDFEIAYKAACWLKPHLVPGLYSVKLNDAYPFAWFCSYFAYQQYNGVDTIDKATQVWKALAERAKKVFGAFVPVCFYSMPIGVRIFGGTLCSEDIKVWKNSIINIVKDADNIAYPKFIE